MREEGIDFTGNSAGDRAATNAIQFAGPSGISGGVPLSCNGFSRGSGNFARERGLILTSKRWRLTAVEETAKAKGRRPECARASDQLHSLRATEGESIWKETAHRHFEFGGKFNLAQRGRSARWGRCR
jgi:hypothetical protein